MRLRSISADASPDEVAAIVASISSLTTGAAGADETAARSRWLETSRRSARRAGIARGEWRLSGRVGRRARA